MLRRWLPGLALVMAFAASGGHARAGQPLRLPKARPKGAKGTTQQNKLFQKDFNHVAYFGFHPGASFSGSEFMLDSWVPLHLIIKNNTKDIFEGVLRCTVRDRRRQNTYDATYQTRVVLAGRGSVKHIVMHVYIPDAALGEQLMGGARGGFLSVALHGYTHWPGMLTEPKTYHIQRVTGEEKRRIHKEMALILSDNLRFLPKNRPTSDGTATRTSVRGEINSLPRRWIGYSGIRTVVWDGLELAKMEAYHRTALKEYVQAGGNLVIAVGENRNVLMRTPFLMNMLPCTLGPQEERDLGQSLLNIAGRRRARITLLTPNANAQVMRTDADGSTPLVIRRDYGAGSVTVVAFSLAADFCRMRTSLAQAERSMEAKEWRKWVQWIDPVLSQRTDFLQGQTQQHVRRAAYTYLKTNATKRIPKHASIFAFLAIYLLVLVPLTYMVFRGWQRLELAWIATPLISVLFFAGSYYVAFRNIEKNLSINDINIVRLSEDGLGGAFTVSLLHNPSYESYDLGFTHSNIVPGYLRVNTVPGSRSDDTFTHDYREDSDQGIWLAQQAIGFNQSRVLESSGVVRFGDGVVIHLKPNFSQLASVPGSVLGTVSNRTGLYLPDTVLIWGQQGVILGPLPPTDEAPLRVADGERIHAINEVCERLCGKSAHPTMASLSLAALDIMAMGEKRPMLFGITQSHPITWRVAGKKADSSAVVIFGVPCPGSTTARVRFQPPEFVEEDYGIYDAEEPDDL